MNRECALELRLLAQSHGKEKAKELLEDRYAGAARSIVFSHAARASKTSASTPTQLRKRSVPANTRKIVRQYISDTTARQRNIVRRMTLFRKRNPHASFPLGQLLDKYMIPNFADFVPMHQMWQSYMKDLLFSGTRMPLVTSMVTHLATADYTGCLVTVERANDVNLVGVRGIVVWDTQLAFVICIPRGNDAKDWLCQPERPGINQCVLAALEVGGLRSVAKRKTVFSFDVQLPNFDKPSKVISNLEIDIDREDPKSDEGLDTQTQDDASNPEVLSFSIIGSRFEIRAVDRLNRKFKNHNIDDII